jgi:hypothetical protein
LTFGSLRGCWPFSKEHLALQQTFPRAMSIPQLLGQADLLGQFHYLLLHCRIPLYLPQSSSFHQKNP